MQLTLLGDLTKERVLRTAHGISDFLGGIHPQTQVLLTEVEKLMELYLCLPVCCLLREVILHTWRL